MPATSDTRCGRDPLPKVALLIETSNAYARGLLHGIETYFREHRAWSIYLMEHGRGDRPPTWLQDWDGQGIIARIENRTIAKALAPLTIPIVDMSAACLIPGVPYVETDDAAIAEAAATHFLERGFRSFAYSGDHHFEWSDNRERHFARIIRERGFPCFTHRHGLETSLTDDEFINELGAWIRKLPKPLAIFSCYDLRGCQVLDACRRCGFAVPEEVAVLGVDNDDVLCSLAPIPLSSIIPNTQRTGYEAAQLLDAMMSGETVSKVPRLIPPLGIATRQSTDVTAVEDKHVARAAQFIRENACSGVSVSDVVDAVPLARRMLEKRFRALLGRTLREEITRVQMLRAKELLVDTALPLAEIASRLGFRHVEYLTVVFKREYGISPSAYRAEHQPKPRQEQWRPTGKGTSRSKAVL